MVARGRNPGLEREVREMRREIFCDEHEHFRAEFRRFVEAEIEPKVEGWNRAR